MAHDEQTQRWTIEWQILLSVCSQSEYQQQKKKIRKEHTHTHKTQTEKKNIFKQ